MIKECVFTDYDDVDLTDFFCDLKDILRIVDGNDIIVVKLTYNQISVCIIILYLRFDWFH